MLKAIRPGGWAELQCSCLAKMSVPEGDCGSYASGDPGSCQITGSEALTSLTMSKGCRTPVTML